MNQQGISDIAAEGAFSVEPYVLSDAFLARIKAAYRLAIKLAPPTRSPFWSLMTSKSQAVHDALTHDGHDAELRSLLTDPAKHHLFYGFDNLFLEDVEALRSPAVRVGRVKQLGDLVRTLAEATGYRMRNEEFGANHWTDRLQPPSAIACLVAIEEAMGPLSFPNPFPGEHGIATSGGIVSYRSVQALYQAWRTKQLSAGRVLEVGGGLGRAAYFCRRFGVADYTIVDLPLTGVAQALYLGAALGESAVTLAGEPRRRGVIAITPVGGLQDQKFDLMVNVDSVTEMTWPEAVDYATCAQRAGARVLSINHEANQYTAAEVFSSMTRQSRSPYWLRPGYVEELFIPGRRRWF